MSNLEVHVQNLAPAESPISTTFFGAPLENLHPERDYYIDAKGNTVRVLDRTWGDGFALCAIEMGALDKGESYVETFEPLPDGDAPDNPASVVGLTPIKVRAIVDDVEHFASLQKMPVAAHKKFSGAAALHTFFGRIGTTQHVAYLHVYESACSTWRLEGFIGTSDFRTKETISYPQLIELIPHKNDFIVIDFDEQRDVTYHDGKTQLVTDDRFAFGQGFPFSGRYIVGHRVTATPKNFRSAHAAKLAPVVAQVTSRTLRNFGPFNTLPKLHPSHQGRERELARADYKNTISRFYQHKGGHWSFDGPYTGVLDPRRTGSTETFGMTKLVPTLCVPEGFPGHLHALLPDIYSEGKRPSHFFENNGLPFMAMLHPNFEPQGQEAHYDANVNGDMLGKEPRFTWHTRPTGDWRSEDWAHSGSSIVLGAHSLLAGSALSRMLCVSDTEFYKSIAPGRNAFYQARGLGRSMLDIVWANLAVGDDALKSHIVDLLTQDPGLKRVREQMDAGHAIVTYEIDLDGDGRKFNGEKPFWMPWSSPGLLLPGLVAAQIHTGTNVADAEITAMAKTLALHGIWPEKESGWWRVADSIVYKLDGSAYDDDAFYDRDLVKPLSYEDWAYPALALTLDRLVGDAQKRAADYCKSQTDRHEQGSAPRNPFGRPVPFFAVPRPFAGGDGME